MLDLLTRLADELAENAPVEAETEALLTEARRAIKEWRVIEVPGCEYFDAEGMSPLIEDEVGSFRLEINDSDLRMELDNDEPRPVQVTVIVRVGGEE